MPEPADVLARIDALEEATRIEAAQLLASALGITRAAAGPVTDEIIDRPLEHRADVSDLSTVLLVAAATDEATRPLVIEALDGAGRKQLILGGAELAIIASLAIAALHIIVSKGRASQSTVIRIEKKADGTETTTINETVTYGVSARLGNLLRTVVDSIKSVGGGGTGS